MICGARATSSTVSNSGAMSSGTVAPFGPRCPHFASSSTESTSSAPCAMLTMYAPIASRPYLRRQCAIVWKIASVRRPSVDSAPSGDSRRSSASVEPARALRVVECEPAALLQAPRRSRADARARSDGCRAQRCRSRTSARGAAAAVRRTGPRAGPCSRAGCRRSARGRRRARRPTRTGTPHRDRSLANARRRAARTRDKACGGVARAASSRPLGNGPRRARSAARALRRHATRLAPWLRWPARSWHSRW